MLDQIKGLHHVTSMAADARAEQRLLHRHARPAPGQEDRQLRRARRLPPLLWRRGRHAGLGDDLFPVPEYRQAAGPAPAKSAPPSSRCPKGSLGFWKERLADAGRHRASSARRSFGEKRLAFDGPGRRRLRAGRGRRTTAARPGPAAASPRDEAIRGFHSASLRLRDGGATEELLKFMGYEDGRHVRRRHAAGACRTATAPTSSTSRRCPARRFADLGAGSVHHIAFAVENRAKQLEVRKALLDTGYQVTPVIDRDYFWAIYFRTPGGVLFEVATNEPGFDRDEDTAHLGEALKLPTPARASARRTWKSTCSRSATEEDVDVDRQLHPQGAARSPGGAAALRSSTAPAATRTSSSALGRDLMPGATIVAPRGDVSEHGAARFFRRTGEGVYDMADLARAHRQDGGLRRGACRGGQAVARCWASAIPTAPTSSPR